MKPYWQSDAGTIYQGDALEVLKQLPDELVHCCITSPPYWRLRDYGIEGQLGLESTPETYVRYIVDIFREVKRVLRNDGTLWLNLGSSYSSGKHKDYSSNGYDDPGWNNRQSRKPPPGFKPKDLIPIPWMVAMALQADGWTLRCDIIWNKKNPMPEPCTDRPTKSHEYLFLMSKDSSYFYDNEAIKDEAADCKPRPPEEDRWEDQEKHDTKKGFLKGTRAYHTRNKRSVWTIATQPFPEAHFATFPEALITPAILAGTSEKGCCSAKIKKLKLKEDLKPEERERIMDYLRKKGLV